MKKKWKKNGDPWDFRYELSQISRVMKIVFFIMLVGLTHLSASVRSQNSVVNLSLKNVSVEEALTKVEKQLKQNFFFNRESVDLERKVNLRFSNAGLDELVRELFGEDFKYRVVDQLIVISKKNENQSQVQPQSVKISGVVKDKQGTVLPGVTVLLKGTSLGVVTDVEGKFSITVPDKAAVTLIFSFVGMKTREIAVHDMNPLTVILEEEVSEMDEVVVTGYQTISREKVTGSTTTITSKQLEERYTPNLLDNLEGRVAGLVTYDGKPLIRGSSSLQAETSPLLVIDGLPVEGNIEDINPYDVENITVLKDAAATAIYGARASNGIIVITTKKARETGKTTIDVSANFTVYEKRNLDYADNFYMTPEQQVEKEKEFYEYYFFNNKGEISDPIGTTSGEIAQGISVDPIHYAYYQFAKNEIGRTELDSRLEELKKNNFAKDYEKHILRNRFLQQYNIALRNRSEKFQSNLVINYRRDNTGVKRAFDNRFTLFYKGSYDMASWLTVNFSLNGLLTKAEESNSTYASNPFNIPAYYSLFNKEGEYSRYSMAMGNDYNTSMEEESGLRSMKFSHLEELQHDRRKTDRRNIRYQGELVFRILEGLTTNGSFIYETERYNEQAYSEAESYVMRMLRNLYTQKNDEGAYTYLIPKEGGKLTALKTEGEYWTARGQVNFNRTFGKHTVDFLAGGEFRQTLWRGTRQLLLGYDDQLQLDATSTVDFGVLSQYETKPWWAPMISPKDNGYDQYIAPAMVPVVEQYHRYASGYANLTYTFDNKYNAFASFRKDYADIYGLDTEFRGKPLWSVGASWNIKRENFLSQVNWLDFLKLRVSYGVTGNIYQGATSRMTAQSVGNNPITRLPYSEIESPGNPSLKWEQTATVNVGADFVLWNNRLRGSVDWYNRKGTDIFALKNIDPSKGFSTMVMNMASLRNNGVEISLSYDWFDGNNPGHFAWRTSLTGSYNKNKITEVDVQSTKARELISSGLQEGYPVNALFSYRFAGLDDTGQPLFYMTDGSAKNDREVGADATDAAVYSGRTDPKVNFGMENRFSYKGISLNVMMVYYGGHKMRVLQANPNPDFMIFSPFPSYNLDSWTPENTDTHVPGFGQYGVNAISNYGTKDADIYVQPADFIKIRNIVLGYDLPKNLLSRIGIRNVAFRFQIDNPKYLWVKNKVGIDPETLSLRRETSYIFGLNFNF